MTAARLHVRVNNARNLPNTDSGAAWAKKFTRDFSQSQSAKDAERERISAQLLCLLGWMLDDHGLHYEDWLWLDHCVVGLLYHLCMVCLPLWRLPEVPGSVSAGGRFLMAMVTVEFESPKS